jgi:hypothetical protein
MPLSGVGRGFGEGQVGQTTVNRRRFLVTSLAAVRFSAEDDAGAAPPLACGGLRLVEKHTIGPESLVHLG